MGSKDSSSAEYARLLAEELDRCEESSFKSTRLQWLYPTIAKNIMESAQKGVHDAFFSGHLMKKPNLHDQEVIKSCIESYLWREPETFVPASMSLEVSSMPNP